jgi:signal transduction histidine kinase
MASQLFESMVSVRPAAAEERPRSEPHLGLGLFIVRLIAEYHGGRAAARNRPDGRGVTVEVAFPLAA